MSAERRWFYDLDPAAAVNPPTGMWKIALAAVGALGLPLRTSNPSLQRCLVLAIGRA